MRISDWSSDVCSSDLMIYYFAVSLPTYGGEDGLSIYLRSALPLIDSEDPLSFFLICYALLLAALFLMHPLVDSRFDAALQCARLTPDRLATLGLAPFRSAERRVGQECVTTGRY